MKCKYCGAEVTGRKCNYCGSDLSEFMRGRRYDRYEDDDYEDAEEDDYDEDDYDDEDEDEDEEYGEITDEMINRIRKLCHKFQRKHEDLLSVYDEDGELIAGKGVKDKLFDVLDIPEDDEVFLIHDDTLFSSGKNGFAITDTGFYCKTLTESLKITPYEDLEDDDEITTNNGVISLNDDEKMAIAYLSGSNKALEGLADLIERIMDILFE